MNLGWRAGWSAALLGDVNKRLFVMYNQHNYPANFATCWVYVGCGTIINHMGSLAHAASSRWQQGCKNASLMKKNLTCAGHRVESLVVTGQLFYTWPNHCSTSLGGCIPWMVSLCTARFQRLVLCFSKSGPQRSIAVFVSLCIMVTYGHDEKMCSVLLKDITYLAIWTVQTDRLKFDIVFISKLLCLYSFPAFQLSCTAFQLSCTALA